MISERPVARPPEAAPLTPRLAVCRVLLLVVSTVVLLAGCSRSKVPADTPGFTVPGTPAIVYNQILPEIRDRIARDTKIVRIDGHGTITMRFSAYLEDHSVRLVEVGLVDSANSASSVRVLSKRFSFVPWSARDEQDRTLETALSELIRRRTGAGE